MYWLEKSCDVAVDRFSVWLYCDVLMNGYISIILMQRKADARHTPTNAYRPSSRSVEAARQVLHAIQVIARIMKSGGLGNANAIDFYPFVAFFTLYYHILHYATGSPNADFASIEDDLILMEKLGSVMQEVGETQDGFFPIVTAIGALNKVCRHALEGKIRSLGADISLILGGDAWGKCESERITRNGENCCY